MERRGHVFQSFFSIETSSTQRFSMDPSISLLGGQGLDTPMARRLWTFLAELAGENGRNGQKAGRCPRKET